MTDAINLFLKDSGAIRDAGGAFGKKEKALEDQYFRKMVCVTFACLASRVVDLEMVIT